MDDYTPFAAAIRSIETGGQADPYGTIGPTTKRADGTLDRPIGAYQIMESNLPLWTEEVLGQRMTSKELLSHPDRDALQDRIFNAKFGEAHQKYGNPQDAASVWFTGRPQSQGGASRDVLGTSGNDYVAKFNAALQNKGALSAANGPAVLDQSGMAIPDAQGVYGPDATMVSVPSTPPNAQPTSGVADSQSTVSRLLANAGLSRLADGLGPKLQGLGASMVSVSNPDAGRTMAQQAQLAQTNATTQRVQQSTFKALIAKGVPQADAIAASLNPDILKAVSAKYFESKPIQVIKTGADFLGQEQYSVLDPSKNTLTPLDQWQAQRQGNPSTTPTFGAPGAPAPSGGPTGYPAMPATPGAAPAAPGAPASAPMKFDFNAFQNAKANGATPDQLKGMLPPVLRAEVESMIKGEASAQTLGRPAQARSAIMMLSHAIDPTFDETSFNARQTFAKGLASSAPSSWGGMKTSANMVIHHLHDLHQSIDGLDNTSLPWLNTAGNAVGQMIGDKATQEGVKNFEAKREVVASELPKFLRGAGAAEADVQHFRDLFDTANSPAQLKAAVRSALNSIRGRLQPMSDTYNDAFRRSEGPDFFLGPREKEIIKQMESDSKPKASAPSATSSGFKVIKVH